MNTNVSTYEGISRLLFAIVIDAAVVLLAQLPPWFALVSIYLFFTALIQWDPFYALSNALLQGHDRQMVLGGTGFVAGRCLPDRSFYGVYTHLRHSSATPAGAPPATPAQDLPSCARLHARHPDILAAYYDKVAGTDRP